MADSEDVKGGGAASPADQGSVDWGSLNEGVSPGADDDDDGAQAPASAESPAASEGEGPASPSPEGAEAEQLETSSEADEGEKPVPETQQEEDSGGEEGAAPTAELALEPPLPRMSPEEEAKFREEYPKLREARIQELMQQYKFDEEGASKLQTEPETVIPLLAAQMQANMEEQLARVVGQLVPQMVQRAQYSARQEEQASQAFFSKWPALAKHRDKVLKTGAAFRAANPDAGPDEAIQAIGEIVSRALKLPAQQAKAAGAKAPGKPGPRKPLAAGSKGTVPAPQKPANPWADLLDD